MPSKKDFQRDIEEKENRIKELETEKLQAEKQSKQAFTQKQLELDEAQESNKKLEDDLKKSQADLSAEKARADQLSKEKQGLQEDLRETGRARAEQEKQQEKSTKEIKALSEELFAVKAQLQEHSQDHGPMKEKLGETEQALADELAQRNQLEAQLKEAKEAIEGMERDKELSDKKRKDEANSQTASLKVAQDKLAECEKAKASLEAQFTEEKAQLEEQVEDGKLTIEQMQVELSESQQSAHKQELMALANAGGKSMAERGQTEHVGFSEKLAQGLAQKVLDLEDQLFNASADAVKQGERLVACAEQLKDTKAKFTRVKDDLEGGRQLLLGKIAGGSCDVSLYSHVQLKELARLALQNNDSSGAST